MGRNNTFLENYQHLNAHTRCEIVFCACFSLIRTKLSLTNPKEGPRAHSFVIRTTLPTSLQIHQWGHFHKCAHRYHCFISYHSWFWIMFLVINDSSVSWMSSELESDPELAEPVNNQLCDTSCQTSSVKRVIAAGEGRWGGGVVQSHLIH